MRIQVAPFLVASSSSIVHSGWQIDTAGILQSLPSRVDSWDYQAVLNLRASLQVDRAAVLEESGLGPLSNLEAIVVVRSSTTKIERLVQRSRIERDTSGGTDFRLSLVGSELGGRLTVETRVVVIDAVPEKSTAPTARGSILWRHLESTDLEGTGAQFPTDAEDFEITRPIHSSTAWILKVDATDPEALFMSAVRLSLNLGVPAVRRMLDGATDSSTAVLISMLDLDVTRQLAQHAIRIDEVASHDVDPEATTLAGVLRLLLAQIWPNTNIATLRHRQETQPELIEAQIQNFARPFS